MHEKMKPKISVAIFLHIIISMTRPQVLALAAEGINIGKEGPVTLVQLATCSGHVYIFDVLENRDLVHAGRLRYVLESVNVLKVASLLKFRNIIRYVLLLMYLWKHSIHEHEMRYVLMNPNLLLSGGSLTFFRDVKI